MEFPWPDAINPLRHIQLDNAARVRQNKRFVFEPETRLGELTE
jgi:hypothetical protein